MILEDHSIIWNAFFSKHTSNNGPYLNGPWKGPLRPPSLLMLLHLKEFLSHYFITHLIHPSSIVHLRSPQLGCCGDDEEEEVEEQRINFSKIIISFVPSLSFLVTCGYGHKSIKCARYTKPTTPWSIHKDMLTIDVQCLQFCTNSISVHGQFKLSKDPFTYSTWSSS